MNRILPLGTNGQVDWELQHAPALSGELLVHDHRRAGLADPEGLARLVRVERLQFIVNVGAYIAVNRAESDADNARLINAHVVAVLTEETATCGVWLVHYPADYVFDGAGSVPLAEDAPTGLLSVYGQTKLEGGQAIRANGCYYLIFRTSWVYAARGGNFAKTMLRLVGQHDELKVVVDQFGAPTSVELIVGVTVQALQRLRWDAELAARVSGTYHPAASGEMSRRLRARFVIEQALERGWELQATPQRILPITTEDYLVPAKYPANSRLDNHKLQQIFGLALSGWRYHVGRVIQELSEQGSLWNVRASSSPGTRAPAYTRQCQPSPSSCCRYTTSR